MKAEKPTREQVKHWMGNSVTKWLFDSLAEDRTFIMESWANGVFTGESVEATSQLIAMALGQLDSIDQIIEKIDELLEEDDEREETAYQ